MDETTLAQRKAEIKEKYPDMFSHPELQYGEVWYGDQVVEVASINVSIYRGAGIPSARLGKEFLKPFQGIPDRKFVHHPIFFNLDEFLKAEEKHKQESKK